MLTLAGCSDDTLGTEPVEEEEMSGDVYLRIRMNIGDGAPTMGRAGETGTVQETPGTVQENAINSVDILIYDIDDDMLVNRIPLDDQQIQLIQGENEAIVPFFAQQGHRVKIYAAVNMTDEMRLQFTFGRSGIDYGLSPSLTTYQDVINRFVPGSNGKCLTGSNGCIPMTGLFRIANSDQADNDVITITREHTSREHPLDIVVNVRRIVAKVHVVVTMDDKPAENTKTYVRARRATDNTKRYGWVSLDDVYYIPNGVSKSTYIFPQYDSNGHLMDMDMALDRYIARGKFDDQLWSSEYAFTYNSELYKRGENNSLGTIATQAEQYNATRMTNTLSGKGYPLDGTDDDYSERYVRGMYCTENYFDTPHNQAMFENYEFSIPMITHVTIAAKMTPCTILVEKDYVEKMDNFVLAYNDESKLKDYGLTVNDFSEADYNNWASIKEKYFKDGTNPTYYQDDFIEITATSREDITYLLTYSLKFNKLWSNTMENNKFPDGTFYVFDRSFEADYDGTQEQFICLTAGAVESTAGHIKSRSVPHVGGWGYYYTYLDNDGSTTGGKTPYTASQVTRNTYYIITVGNFGFPGGTITSPLTIKTNTIAVGWNYVGRGDVTLH